MYILWSYLKIEKQIKINRQNIRWDSCMLGMRKTTTLLTEITKLHDKCIKNAKKHTGVASKIVIENKIIAVQEKSRRARIKINMCYMLRQTKVIY